MKVVICGAGQVGAGIARRLAAEENDITVIDQNPQLVRQITDTLDVKGLVGHGAHPDVLDKAGAKDSDLLIAVTYADEVNMVACQVADSLFGVPLKIARVRAQSYLHPAWRDLFAKEALPIDVIISPEIEVARSILRRIDVPGAFDTLDFADGMVQVVGARIEEATPLVNVPLSQVTELFPDLTAIVGAISRGGKLFVPRDSDHLEAGDDIYFIAGKRDVQRTLDLVGAAQNAGRRAIIVGGGNIGLHVARELERNHPGVKVKLIEQDKARAEAAADELSRTVVLHGDGLDQELLAEADVSETETIIAVTNDDETNILTSLIAKRAGAKRAITLVNNQGYAPLVRSLGIDVFVDPRATTVSTILQHIRRGRIKALQSIEEGAAEIIEAEVLDTSPLMGKSLREIDLPDGIIMGALLRKGKVEMPTGSTVFETGDRVVVLAAAGVVKKVEQLFRVSLEYF